MRKNAMVIEIIAVGSELLTPFYQDTNSLYITSRLNGLGLKVSYKTIVGDNRESLLSCFEQALKRASMIFITGGLGPTSDDITREVFAEALGRELEFRKDLLKNIQNRFQKRGLDMPPSSEKQAYVIKGSEVIQNKFGTAPGLWVEDQKKTSVLLPGPPLELKTMIDSAILPRMDPYKKGFMEHKTLKITGITESQTESLISDLYPESPEFNLSVLAYPSQIEIHIFSRSQKSLKQARESIHSLTKSLTERLKDHVFSRNGDELEEVIGKLLVKNKSTLSIAESCTGGLLGDRITNVPGSSRYFLQGVQVYSNQAKTQLLGVPKEILNRHGAVSEKTALLMAEGTREKSGTDYGLAITGIAGPGGGTKEKPVGLVFTALSWDNGAKVSRNQFIGNRKIVKFRATQKALDMLRRHIIFE